MCVARTNALQARLAPMDVVQRALVAAGTLVAVVGEAVAEVAARAPSAQHRPPLSTLVALVHVVSAEHARVSQTHTKDRAMSSARAFSARAAADMVVEALGALERRRAGYEQQREHSALEKRKAHCGDTVCRAEASR